MPPMPPLSYYTPSPVDRARRVSRTLFIVAGLQLFMGPILTILVSRRLGLPIPPHTHVLLWTGAGVLFAFAILARRKPLPAAVASLGLFISIYTIEAATGRIAFTQGLIYKVVILILLVRAIRTAQPPLPKD